MFSYTFSEIAFILMSIYCIKCTWGHLDDPEKTLKERDEVLSAMPWNIILVSAYFLLIATITIFWGLSLSYSDLSFYSFLGSQILNAIITQQLLNKTLLARSKHLYLAEVWSTLSWLLIACEICVKQDLFQ